MATDVIDKKRVAQGLLTHDPVLCNKKNKQAECVKTWIVTKNRLCDLVLLPIRKIIVLVLQRLFMTFQIAYS